MSSEIAAVGVAAVLIFWMVGAYNRLTALRYAIGEAYGQVDEVLQRRAQAAAALGAALQRRLASEQGSLAALAEADAAVRAAASVVRQRPSAAAPVAGLSSAEAAMAGALARVRALVETQPELAAEPELAQQIAALVETASRLGFARQLFNTAVQAYNEATRTFPTRLLVRLFGFDAAAPL